MSTISTLPELWPFGSETSLFATVIRKKLLHLQRKAPDVSAERDAIAKEVDEKLTKAFQEHEKAINSVRAQGVSSIEQAEQIVIELEVACDNLEGLNVQLRAFPEVFGSSDCQSLRQTVTNVWSYALGEIRDFKEFLNKEKEERELAEFLAKVNLPTTRDRAQEAEFAFS